MTPGDPVSDPTSGAAPAPGEKASSGVQPGAPSHDAVPKAPSGPYGAFAPARLAEAKVPWDAEALGKNRRLRIGKGRLYRPPRSSAWSEALSLALRASATAPAPWPPRKTWLSIVAVKPDHRGDAVNLVDGACDAARDGLGVDDRWFALAAVDWRIDRRDPGWVHIRVWQTGFRPQLPCPRCGDLLEAVVVAGGKLLPLTRCGCPPADRRR